MREIHGGRFTLVIHVTKNDDRGRIIQAISRGQCIDFHTIEKATIGQAEFHGIVDLIPRPKPGEEFGAYGLSIIQDEETGDLSYPRPI